MKVKRGRVCVCCNRCTRLSSVVLRVDKVLWAGRSHPPRFSLVPECDRLCIFPSYYTVRPSGLHPKTLIHSVYNEQKYFMEIRHLGIVRNVSELQHCKLRTLFFCSATQRKAPAFDAAVVSFHNANRGIHWVTHQQSPSNCTRIPTVVHFVRPTTTEPRLRGLRVTNRTHSLAVDEN